mmetsp:Transcript_3559/g.10221  ORF Transcript_3559/g.10221 Transcript_3559/m.10221 type:complete len:442 (+) Transcript_3559:140-1465(+)
MNAEADLALRPGFMPKGNDLHHGLMTLAEAREWCLAHDECRGFTYQSTDPAPADKIYVWFKSTEKIAPGAGWHSCVKDGDGDGRRRGSSKMSLAGMFSGQPKPPAAGTTRPATAALALLTRKPLYFDWWLDYHITLGISHFFIHVEDTPELLTFLDSEPYKSLVTVTRKGEGEGHFRDNYWTLQDRQRAHVNASLARCREMGIDWLFHVDDDEVIWLEKPFREIVAQAPKATTNITFTNLEAIPTTTDPVNYFEHIRTFTKKRMLAYVNGKPAGRAVAGTKLDGPHRFSGPSYAVPMTDAVVLHYESCDFNQWCGKFRNQVDCTPERKASIPFPYYRDSISLFQEFGDPDKHRDKWLEFYRRRKIQHYSTMEIKAAAKHIPKLERPRLIDPLPGAGEAAAAVAAAAAAGGGASSARGQQAHERQEACGGSVAPGSAARAPS